MNLRALIASALLLPACAAQRAQTSITTAPPTGLQQAEGPIGTPHPFVFQAAASDGRWVVACQAREDTNGDGKLEVLYNLHGGTRGDALLPYLFLEPGEGERLDDFLTSDPTGRYLVVVRGGSLRLLDTHTGQDTELAAPGTFPDSTAPGSALPVSFSLDGRRLLLVSGEPEQRTHATLIHLEDGRRQEVPHGPGELGEASLFPEGDWAMFGVLTEDTDGDGKLTWPQVNTSLSPRFCRGPIMSYGRYGYTGDRPDYVVAPVTGGPRFQMSDVLRPVGDSVLRRDEQGALFVENVQGQRTEWVPTSCRGAIHYVDVERKQLLVSCTAQGNALELHGATVHQPLGLSVEPPRRESLYQEPTLLYPVTPTTQADGAPALSTQSVVDLEKRTVHPIPVPGEVHYTEGTRALVVQASESDRSRRLWFFDVATGEKRELGQQEAYGLMAAGSFVYAGGLLVDMNAGQLVGQVDGELQALDTQGRVLRISSEINEILEQQQAPLGPIQWSSVSTPR